MQAWRTTRGALCAAGAGIAVLVVASPQARAEAALVEGQTAAGGTTHSFAQNEQTQADAINAAMRNCATTSFNCRVLQQFNSTCFALAYAQGGGYGYAFGSDLPEAHRAALGQCIAANPYSRCDIVKSFCDTVNQQQAEAQRQQYLKDWYACANDNDQSACDRDLAMATSDSDRANLAQWRERIQRAVAESGQKAVASTFESDLNECGRFSILACDRGLSSPLASSADIDNMKGWRAVAVAYTENRAACRAGDAGACDAALASPAIDITGRQLITMWKNKLPLTSRLATTIITVPDSIKFGSIVLAFLAFTLILSYAALPRRRREGSSGISNADATAAATAISHPRLEDLPHLESPSPSQAAATASPDDVAWSRMSSSSANPNIETPSSSLLVPIAIIRDTPGALVAMQVALAFIDEVKTAKIPDPDEKEGRKEHLNTLALASDQLRRAETLDPDAVLEGLSDDDIPYRYTLSELKAAALFQEGLTHRYFDTSRAVPALIAASRLHPTNAAIFYMLGVVQAANRNKAEAVAALQRALELAPNDIQIRKELIRAEAMTGAEIATYKVTRAGERVYDAGVATANAGIKTWNVFAITYNIVTLPIRIPLKIVQKALSVLNYIVHG